VQRDLRALYTNEVERTLDIYEGGYNLWDDRYKSDEYHWGYCGVAILFSSINMIKMGHLPIVVMAMFCLLSGLWSGLTRIGWDVAVLPLTAHHGAIMVGGFLGTLIALEKIIPLKRKLLYSIPVLNALSVVFFFTDQPRIGIYALIISSAALLLVFLYFFPPRRSIICVLMSLGAICWLIGNILLLTKRFYPLAFPWWTAFALFIIVAERLEIMTALPVRDTDKKVFIGILLSFVVGAFCSFHGAGNVTCGIILVGISLWLLGNDLIGIDIKKDNMPKYVAIGLLTGYIALLFTGIFFFVLSDRWLNYDVIVHTFFIGFVFSMIFAHGPMILPGIMGISANPFHKILYVWLALLQVSWLVRIFADFALEMETRKISGLLSAAAILGYFVTIAVLTFRRHSRHDFLPNQPLTNKLTRV
jgi:hypothetical protein